MFSGWDALIVFMLLVALSIALSLTYFGYKRLRIFVYSNLSARKLGVSDRGYVAKDALGNRPRHNICHNWVRGGVYPKSRPPMRFCWLCSCTVATSEEQASAFIAGEVPSTPPMQNENVYELATWRSGAKQRKLLNCTPDQNEPA
jgi:hypothetical protein